MGIKFPNYSKFPQFLITEDKDNDLYIDYVDRAGKADQVNWSGVIIDVDKDLQGYTLSNCKLANVLGITPSLDNTYDLGSSTNRWANLHAANVNSTNITVDNIKILTSAVIPTSPPDNPSVGSIYFDPTSNTLNIYNGTNWVSITLQ
ncbi:hypothetical protein [Methanocaldococcus sp.]